MNELHRYHMDSVARRRFALPDFHHRSNAALIVPATAGRSYDILSATNITNSFQVRASVTPSNKAAQWTQTSPASALQRFYRVRTSN